MSQAPTQAPQPPKIVPKVAALIPAAGAGTRLGLGPKAFVEVRGRSLLARSIAALTPYVDEVIVALPANLSAKQLAELTAELTPKISTPTRFIVGGQTRQKSVYKLLLATAAELVLVHDAARPFLPASVLKSLIVAAKAHGAATVALPMADTLVKAQVSGQWGHLVDRSGLWAVQTPQGFSHKLLLGAHQTALAEAYVATDDAGLVARTGQAVALVSGDARLMKITTPSDLQLAEALAQVWDAEANA